ncbi:hypothetical protein D3C71_1817140 [compost metagenome]
MQRNQRAERADHFDQARWQADFLFGLAQRRKYQVGVFRVTSTARKGYLPAVGREPLGAQGQYQFGLFATGNGQKDRRLGKPSVGFQ